MANENLRLRSALRDLVALSTIPAGWIGIEPRTIATGLADILAGSLGFDFAFVRMLDPTGGVTIDVTSGRATRSFLDWLQTQLSTLDESLRRQTIQNIAGFDERPISLRGMIVPIGFNAYAGLVAVGCERSDFPTEADRMLLTVAANHAATAFRSANLVNERRQAEQEVCKARDELEMKVAERTAELQQAMVELARSEAKLIEAQRVSQTGSFVWNVSTHERIGSREFFRILGFDEPHSVTWEMVLERAHPEDRAQVVETVRQASRSGKDLDYEHRLLMPDRSVRHVHVVAHAGRNSAGQLEYVGAVVDVTAAKHAEEKLHKTQSELARVTRVTTLGELTASIAHEVNQPLAGVIANAEACLRWLDRENPDLEAARRSVDWVIKDGNRATEVIRRLRSLVNKTDSEKTPLDINDVVNEVVALVQRELASHQILLQMKLAPALPMILGDRVQLQQVIINLVVNGIEAMQPVTDRPHELVIRSGLDDTQQVFVSVTDCGVGISAENEERMFNAFFTTKSSGMGMGLSICRSIMEAHDGRLWATACTPHGATFQFTLPMKADTASNVQSFLSSAGAAMPNPARRTRRPISPTPPGVH
jgi:C4-dicarboxylate-specific signal transduction histidine kinase